MTVSAKQLRERLARRINDAGEIIATAEREGRELTASERTRIQALHEEARGLETATRAAEMREMADRQVDLPPFGGSGLRRLDDSPEAYIDGLGNRVPVLRNDQSFASAVSGETLDSLDRPVGQSNESANVGELIAGWLTGDWSANRKAALQNFQSGGSDTGGGYLLSPAMSARVIDLARNKSVIMRAGARTIPMGTSELTLARVTGDPTAYWRHEGVSITKSDMTFGSIKLVARVLSCLVPVSIELLEDARNAGGAIQNAIASALALELDRAALRGDGEGAEPRGVRFWDGVSTTAVGGTPTYDNLLDGITPIEASNHTPNAWVISPTVNGFVRKLKDDNSNYLATHPDIARLQKLVSNQIPENLGAGGDESELFFGDFTQVLIGMRTRVTVEIFSVGTSGDDNALTDMKRWIRAYLRVDAALEHPEAFSVLTGVSSS